MEEETKKRRCCRSTGVFIGVLVSCSFSSSFLTAFLLGCSVVSSLLYSFLGLSFVLLLHLLLFDSLSGILLFFSSGEKGKKEKVWGYLPGNLFSFVLLSLILLSCTHFSLLLLLLLLLTYCCKSLICYYNKLFGGYTLG